MSKTNLQVLEEEARLVLQQHPEEFTPPELRNWMIQEFKHELKPDICSLIERLLGNHVIELVKEDLPDSTYRVNQHFLLRSSTIRSKRA